MLGRLGQIACALAVAAVASTGCGDDGADEGELASLAPPDAPLFAEAVIRPEGQQAETIESFAGGPAGSPTWGP